MPYSMGVPKTGSTLWDPNILRSVLGSLCFGELPDEGYLESFQKEDHRRRDVL